jgi:hypothetical protein
LVWLDIRAQVCAAEPQWQGDRNRQSLPHPQPKAYLGEKSWLRYLANWLALECGFKASSATDDHHQWCEQEPSQEWQHSGDHDVPSGFAESGKLRLLLVGESSKPLGGELCNAGGANHDAAEVGRRYEQTGKLGKWVGYLGYHDPNESEEERNKAHSKAFPERAGNCRPGFFNSNWEEQSAHEHKAPESEGNTRERCDD